MCLQMAAPRPTTGSTLQYLHSITSLRCDAALLLLPPLQFPSGASVCWAISDDPTEGLRGRCTVQGARGAGRDAAVCFCAAPRWCRGTDTVQSSPALPADALRLSDGSQPASRHSAAPSRPPSTADVEYLLVPEDAAMTASLYATPSSAQGCVAPIARRMTVVRASQAPLLCFGDDGKQQRKQTVAGKQQGSGAAAAALSPAAGDKIARKKKRHSEAAAAAQQQEPQRQQQEGGTAQAAGAAPAAEQQQAEGSAVKQQQKQQKAKRKHEQGEAAVAAPEAAALPSAEKKAKRKKSQRSEKP